jgi:hypothetical protein
MGHGMNDDDDDNGGEFIINPPFMDNEAPGELQLIQEPRKVEQIKINYAKTAKFVDVRALKETIWKGIKENNVRYTLVLCLISLV